MVTAGWVGRVEPGASARLRWGKRARQSDDNWVLLINPEKLKLADVYRLFVFGGVTLALDAGAADPGADSPMTLDTQTLARQVEAAVERGLEQTLAEHFAQR
jgi:membrane protein